MNTLERDAALLMQDYHLQKINEYFERERAETDPDAIVKRLVHTHKWRMLETALAEMNDETAP